MWFDDGTSLGYLVLGTVTEHSGTQVKIKYENKVRPDHELFFDVKLANYYTKVIPIQR